FSRDWSSDVCSSDLLYSYLYWPLAAPLDSNKCLFHCCRRACPMQMGFCFFPVFHRVALCGSNCILQKLQCCCPQDKCNSHHFHSLHLRSVFRAPGRTLR